jgi:lipid-A-disaccharide synthase
MDDREIFFSVGDDSGDLHAANLMEAMRKLEPALRFSGIGMDRMARAGLEPLQAAGAGGSAMWLHNLLRLGDYRRRLALCAERFQRRPPDLVVPVDFGGFNLCLCRAAAARGIPVFYYIPPQVWAHGRYRLKKLRKWTTRCGLIYPFELDLYRRHGVEAEYVGHPLFDELERHPPGPEAIRRLRDRFGPDLVGLFPGSRRQEVRAHFPLMLEACRRIRREVPAAAFAVLCAPPMRALAEELLAGAGDGVAVLLEDVRPAELAAASRLCIAKSGTITLEIASQGTPMVVVYRATPLVAFLGNGLSDTPYMGLVNVLAGREVCPERPMWRDEPEWLAGQALRLLRDARSEEACRRGIAEALSEVARPGASARAARSALELIARPT